MGARLFEVDDRNRRWQRLNPGDKMMELLARDEARGRAFLGLLDWALQDLDNKDKTPPPPVLKRLIQGFGR